MHNPNLRTLPYAAGIAAAAALIGMSAAQAADKTWDFTNDPAGELTIAGNNDQPWQNAGGNPGGFLALTCPQNSQYAAIVFPNLDPGKIVTGNVLTYTLTGLVRGATYTFAVQARNAIGTSVLSGRSVAVRIP